MRVDTLKAVLVLKANANDTCVAFLRNPPLLNIHMPLSHRQTPLIPAHRFFVNWYLSLFNVDVVTPKTFLTSMSREQMVTLNEGTAFPFRSLWATLLLLLA